MDSRVTHMAGIAVALTVSLLARAAGPQPQTWPTLEQQLQTAGIEPGTALERLVRDNQSFGILRPEEAVDSLGIPPWLRVWYRRQHPGGPYLASDPTGGYPRVLKDTLAWMLGHQDLAPGPADAPFPPMPETAVVGTNLRVSGLQTSPRSESDIRINFWAPQKIVAASNTIARGGAQAQFYSSDGGATWGQTYVPLGGDSYNSDPAVDWTSDGTAWTITMGIKGGTYVVRAYSSTDGGATWTLDGTPSGAQKKTDKCLMWVDHGATSPFKDRIYVIWHNGNTGFVGVRTPGSSGTWQAPVQVTGPETTGTPIGGDVTTDAAGNAFAFWPDTGSRGLFVAKSSDGGASFGTPVRIATTYDSYDIGVPSFDSRRALIYLSVGTYRTSSKNLVYATWVDLTGASGCTTSSNEPGSNVSSTCKTRIWFSRSTDGGAAWSAPVMLNNQASLNDQYNQRLAVDPTTGALAVMYYDTVGDPGRLMTDVWMQYSFDDGVTWSTPQRVTTAMTDETCCGADSGNQYGDYNGMTGYGGLFFPSWTDRRGNAVGDPEEIWTAGPSRVVPPPGVADGTAIRTSAMKASRNDSTGTSIHLTWDATCGSSQYAVVSGASSQLPTTYSGTYGVSTTSCALGIGGAADWTNVPPAPPGGFLWWLVVGTDGDKVEGPWGRNSGGVERAGPGTNGSSGQCGTTKSLASTCGQ